MKFWDAFGIEQKNLDQNALIFEFWSWRDFLSIKLSEDQCDRNLKKLEQSWFSL